MYNPLISIIIPVYNREYTLDYCIDSVLNQTYANWELLLVDDGSSDNSTAICKAYAANDKRIKYFYQENLGAGPARNKGLQNAGGEWVTFLDSDDAIMPNHLEQLQKYGEGNDLVMVNHCTSVLKDGVLIKKSEYWKNIDSSHIKGNKEIIKFLYTTLNPLEFYNYDCWDKFFSMKIIKENNLSYPSDVPTGQDQMFVVNYFKYTQDFFFSKEGTYSQTPIGNENIDHLALKLRTPEEFLHCHKRNFDNLMELYHLTGDENVKLFAINYIVKDTLERAVIRYTSWRNRLKLGKPSLLKFINDSFKPILKDIEDDIHFIKDTKYQKQVRLILSGREGEVYDYWYCYCLLHDLKYAVLRRLHLI